MSILGEKQIEFAKLRVIDFYFVFPHLVCNISLPRIDGASQLKKVSKSLPLPYEKLPDTKSLFSEMGDFQIQAAHILKAKNILNLHDGVLVCKGDTFSSDLISELVCNRNFLKDEFFSTLVNVFYQIPLLGDNGLKMRTGLMEYRYDAV